MTTGINRRPEASSIPKGARVRFLQPAPVRGIGTVISVKPAARRWVLDVRMDDGACWVVNESAVEEVA